MSTIEKNSKDTIIWASREDHATPSKIQLPELELEPGTILPNGDINWNCPCLGTLHLGPCGLEYREVRSCFHYSKTEPKGSECRNIFSEMMNCMLKYPSLYPLQNLDDVDETTPNNKTTLKPPTRNGQS